MNNLYNLGFKNRKYLGVVLFGAFFTSHFLNKYKIFDQNNNNILEGIENKIETKLVNKKIVTHDTILLELKLPNDKDNFGLPIGNHIRIFGLDKKNNEIFRNYTPISKVNKKGSFDILLKVYYPCEKFPNGGILTQYLNNLNLEEKVFISGPEGNLVYKGNKMFELYKENPKTFSKLSLVGGGTGITPLYQLIKHIIEEKNFDSINLLFANRTEDDILLKNELNELKDSNLVNVNYSVDNSNNKNWKGYVGFIKKEWLKQSFPEPSKDHLVCVCGPPIMSNMVKNQLLELGHSLDNIYIF